MAAQTSMLSDIRTVCIFLGPYRNLTTLTASILHLHPACQALNHAGVRILDAELMNFLVDYSDDKFDQFCEFAITASQGGKRGSYGGSITLSHAFDENEIREAFQKRYGALRVKHRIQCLVWKESLRVSRLLRERQVDIGDLLRRNDKIRFLMPIRNPLDCAESHLQPGHGAMATMLRSDNSQDVKALLEAILEELAWFMGLSRHYPDRFFSFFEFEFNEELLGKLCRFLQLARDARWMKEALQCYRLKSKYQHESSLIDHYKRLVGHLFPADVEFVQKLGRFAAN
jgi:hypothetical protein